MNDFKSKFNKQRKINNKLEKEVTYKFRLNVLKTHTKIIEIKSKVSKSTAETLVLEEKIQKLKSKTETISREKLELVS